jgi:2-polyprenyl-3-methyl-5-hydroxy-6-metoxy-1,4-benzoquinol methylase
MKHPSFSKIPISSFHGMPSFVDDEPYVQAFGLQWLRHAKTQLDSYTGLTITKDRMSRMFGPVFSTLDGKVVLEAGCGAGRFTEILLEKNALVTAIDLSDAVVANLENNGSSPNLRIARASIVELPFEKEQFDIVFCPGVVQHTPNPVESITKLYEQVKPGGWFVFDQYRYNLSSLLKVTWVVRFIVKRMSAENGLKVTDWLVKILLPIHKKVRKRRFLEVLLFRFSPVTSHYAGYPNMSDEDQVAWAKLNTHDTLTDFHKHMTSIHRVKRLIETLGGINQVYCVMPYTIEVRCQKPELDSDSATSDKPVTVKPKKSTVVSG